MVVESFLSPLIKIYGRHIYTVYSDRVGGGTWLSEAYVFFWVLTMAAHTSFKKSIIEKAIYSTSKIEANFDD